MPLVKLKAILDAADSGGYAVGAFNVVDLEFLEGVMSAAEGLRAPVILNVAEVHFPYLDLETLCPAILARIGRSGVPVALNLDHGLTEAALERSLACGFSSVMVDASALPYEENVHRTRRTVERCRPLGVSVEAELGCVGGDEGGALESLADSRLYTDPAQARDFVAETGIDALAVAIGNSHGRYKGKPRLDFNRLAALRHAAGIPLVLHGGSGIPEADFRRAISLGIRKINYFTGMSEAALGALRLAVGASGERYNDYPELNLRIRAAVQKEAGAQIRIFGAEGKAD